MADDASPSIAASSVRHENRRGRTRKHALGGSPKNKFPEPRVSVRAHDQKIGIPISHVSFKHTTDAASFGIYFVEDHVGPMSGHVLRKLRTRPPGVDSLFFGHGENTNAFRFLQNGHRIAMALVAARLKSQATITVS